MERYERIETIKESNKSNIYLCFDNLNNRLVIEKQLNGKLDIYNKLITLKHKNLPECYDTFYKDDITFVYEEFIDGKSLFDAKASPKEVSNWFIEICNVLEFLHKNNIIHRDIKPSNILIGADDCIRLIDFDAARTPNSATESDTKLLGTAGFAPPEQYGFSQTDYRADIYALGVTLKFLLGDKSDEKIYRNIINKCTEFEPKKRFKNITSLKKAWKFKFINYISPIIYLSLSVFISLFGWNFYQNNQAFITELRFPNEELLCYTTSKDYMIANAKDLRNSLIETNMYIDLNNDKIDEVFTLSSDYDGVIHLDITSYNKNIKIDLLNLMKFDFKFNYYLHKEDTYYGDIDLDDDFYIQVTCINLENSASDNKEIIVSVGNYDGILVSAVYEYNEDIIETSDLLIFKGYMWGSNTVRLTENDFLTEVEGSPYAKTHYYFYIDGVQDGLVMTNFEKHTAYLRGELSNKEVAEYVASGSLG